MLGSVEQRVSDCLDGVLRWAEAVRANMDRDSEQSREHQMQGHAYVGGVLGTLLHLELLSCAEHNDWHGRLMRVLGDPPGGYLVVDG